MMKKLFGALLAGAMFATITGCGAKTTETTAAETTVAETTVEETTAEEATVEETTEESTEEATDAAEVGENAGTLGETLLLDFENRTAENADVTAMDLAEGIISNEVILFGGATMEVEEGLLTGFGNAEITGFEEGVMFGPVISTIPFVGYVFDTEDAESAEALVAVLTENANPRWNVCTEAEETVVGTAGDKVFFLMCPKSLEE